MSIYNFNRYKIIALFGKSGSGKDTIRKWMVSCLPNTHNIISCTTRPKRENERNGIDYNFLPAKVFTQELLDGELIEATQFNNWFYGTSLRDLDINKINVGVFNIDSIKCLLGDNRLEILPVYIKSSDKMRLMRALQREEHPNCTEICRRFLSDEKDFKDIDFEYITYINNNNDSDFDIYKTPQIAEFLKDKTKSTIKEKNYI